jgi:GNAT superfamily N-acetyltransferase
MIVEVRGWVPLDKPIIVSTWLRSIRRPRTDRGRAWFAEQCLMEKLLGRSDVRIACLEGLPHYVLGWSCVEGSCLHGVYVKSAYRGYRIGKLLAKGCDVASVAGTWLDVDQRRLR